MARPGRLAAFLAAMFFAGLAALPWLLAGKAAPTWAQAAQSASAVPLPTSPTRLAPVTLATVAQPVDPGGAPASIPSVDATRAAALVVSEDQRLRTLLRHSSRLVLPTVVSVPGAPPTLVLPARPAPYTITDLLAARAVLRQPAPGSFVLVDSVLVEPSATLRLTQGVTSLLMNSTPAGFTSLVAWGGTLSLAGTAAAPLTITGWDQVAARPAVDRGFGRPYIRAVGARLDLLNVRASSLGFWSGRTGGVAWTGINRRPATGGATSSTFVGDVYGAFVSHGSQVAFTSDLFEGNELDGLRLHRNADNSLVTGSASVRNGGNGFVVSRGSIGDVLRGNAAVHNARNGYVVDGQPLVNGASPSGGTTAASVGTVLAGNEATNNLHTGILVQGGAGTLIQDNLVCGPVTGIAIRSGAVDTTVSGNDVECGGRVALSIGPSVVGTTVPGNIFNAARIGILIRNSPGVRIMHNTLSAISVFAISVRGTSPGVVGNDNAISGLGLQPIDVEGGAPTPLLTSSNLKGWQHRSTVTLLGYLRFHPLLTTWLVTLLAVLLCWFATRVRRRPARPYTHALPWHGTEAATGRLSAAMELSGRPIQSHELAPPARETISAGTS